MYSQTSHAGQYEDSWRDFRQRTALLFAGVLIWLGALIVWFFLKPAIAKFEELVGVSPMPIVLILVALVTMAAVIYSNFWACPRCKKLFAAADGFNAVITKAWLVKRCRNCRLPKYYGSKYFTAYWGPEKAEEFSQRIKNGTL
jgi:hypothetical protein